MRKKMDAAKFTQLSPRKRKPRNFRKSRPIRRNKLEQTSDAVALLVLLLEGGDEGDPVMSDPF
jgi:hypothetical protein